MKKRIVAILLIAMLIVTVMCFTGCDETMSSETNKAPFKWKMELVDEDWGFYVYREPVTDIMYILYNYSNEGGLTVMYDTDGTPLTYDEYIAMRDGKQYEIFELYRKIGSNFFAMLF